MHRTPIVVFVLLCLTPLLAGCQGGTPRGPGKDAVFVTEILGSQTAGGIGAGQGIMKKGELLYLYGDVRGNEVAGEQGYGVIKEYRLAGEGFSVRIEPTGREIRCTRDGVNIAPHPTGLTHHPDFGTFMGDTVAEQGIIFHIDFERALSDGNLDNAVLNMVVDDAAANGVRPEFVEYNGRWYIATADYGNRDNEVRLYDIDKLKKATRVIRPSLIVERFPSGPFVQTLHYDAGREQLVLVQNQRAGQFYRLTFATLGTGVDLSKIAPLDMPEPSDELEGFAWIGEDTFITLSASQVRNVHFVRLKEVVDPLAEEAGASEDTGETEPEEADGGEAEEAPAETAESGENGEGNPLDPE